MSHELLVVLLPSSVSNEDIEKAVNALVRPHSDLDDADRPDSRCDGWVIGGRFDGSVYGRPLEYGLSVEEFQARYGFDYEKVEQGSNVRPVCQIEEAFWIETNAFLTPNGIWTSCFDPQFKDLAFENPTNGPKWKHFLSTMVASHQDSLAVVVDVHM